MPSCFQVNGCKQQMLARIADQKADCEMVSAAFISKLPGVLFLPSSGICLHVPLFWPQLLSLLTMRSCIDMMIAHLAVRQQGRQKKQGCGQSALCPDALQILHM